MRLLRTFSAVGLLAVFAVSPAGATTCIPPEVEIRGKRSASAVVELGDVRPGQVLEATGTWFLSCRSNLSVCVPQGCGRCRREPVERQPRKNITFVLRPAGNDPIEFAHVDADQQGSFRTQLRIPRESPAGRAVLLEGSRELFSMKIR